MTEAILVPAAAVLVGTGVAALAGTGTYNRLIAVGTTDGERRAVDGINDGKDQGDDTVGGGVAAIQLGGVVAGVGLAGYGVVDAADGVTALRAGRTGLTVASLAFAGAALGVAGGLFAGTIGATHASDRIADAAR